LDQFAYTYVHGRVQRSPASHVALDSLLTNNSPRDHDYTRPGSLPAMWPPRWDSSRSPAPSAAAAGRRTTRSSSFVGSSPPRCSPPPHRFSHGYATPSPLGIGPAATVACSRPFAARIRRRRWPLRLRLPLLALLHLHSPLLDAPVTRTHPQDSVASPPYSGRFRPSQAPASWGSCSPRRALPLLSVDLNFVVSSAQPDPGTQATYL
jgi:hypothetical protein